MKLNIVFPALALLSEAQPQVAEALPISDLEDYLFNVITRSVADANEKRSSAALHGAADEEPIQPVQNELMRTRLRSSPTVSVAAAPAHEPAAPYAAAAAPYAAAAAPAHGPPIPGGSIIVTPPAPAPVSHKPLKAHSDTTMHIIVPPHNHQVIHSVQPIVVNASTSTSNTHTADGAPVIHITGNKRKSRQSSKRSDTTFSVVAPTPAPATPPLVAHVPSVAVAAPPVAVPIAAAGEPYTPSQAAALAQHGAYLPPYQVAPQLAVPIAPPVAPAAALQVSEAQSAEELLRLKSRQDRIESFINGMMYSRNYLGTLKAAPTIAQPASYGVGFLAPTAQTVAASPALRASYVLQTAEKPDTSDEAFLAALDQQDEFPGTVDAQGAFLWRESYHKTDSAESGDKSINFFNLL